MISKVEKGVPNYNDHRSNIYRLCYEMKKCLEF